jgi:predicted secreted protein
MSTEKGLACLLLVGDTAADATAWVALEGQVDTGFEGSSDLADTTDKTSDGWKTGMGTTRSGTVSVSGNLKPAGARPNFDALQTAWVTGGTHDCKIVFDVAGTGFQGVFSVTSFSVNGSATDAGKYSMTLTPTAALVGLP